MIAARSAEAEIPLFVISVSTSLHFSPRKEPHTIRSYHRNVRRTYRVRGEMRVRQDDLVAVAHLSKDLEESGGDEG